MNSMNSSHPQPVSLDRIFQKNEVLSTRKVGDEIILVPIRGKLAQLQQIFSINPVGAFIWDQLDGVRDLRSIKLSLVETFDVEEATAEVDLESHIKDLVEADLIIEVDRASD